MLPERRRTKKLIVAFHFQRSNQAGWKCDACRKSGLAQQRRCGWGERRPGEHGPPVWSRGGAAAWECPKTFITGESLTLLEEFQAWKLGGIRDWYKMPARTVDGFLALELELRREMERGDR